MENKTIKLSCGEVTLRKPNAGQRNKALMKADTKDGLKTSIMMVELLPACIGTHPWGVVKVSQALDRLSIDDYDLLIDGLKEVMQPSGDVTKKSEEQ